MNRKIFHTLCVLAVSLTSLISYSQTPKKIKEFPAKNIESVSVDRLGNLFLIFKNGSIKKYDANGKVLASLKKGMKATLVEPWFHPSVFSYFRAQQQYTFYNHDLKVIQQQRIDPAVAVDPFFACPTNDNKLLVLDKADWSIKKVNPNTNKVLSEFSIDTTGLTSKPEFSYIREYQNLIFLLDKNSGIFIFSNLGKKINHIPCKIQNFGFYGEELFYLSEDRIIFYDLYSESTREVKVETGKFVIVTDERIFVVRENDRVIIYDFLVEESEGKPKEK
ncbi:MAG: hypothetical protein HY015_07755 [Bacteroidetes bacterium]|nr:hypothetical protein [Bacteroidota bacterium]MBI3482853.1 hypothetical protein [Bacteroidota bacterium]